MRIVAATVFIAGLLIAGLLGGWVPMNRYGVRDRRHAGARGRGQ